MSLPIAATGPENVEMKPILTVFCCASAGPAINASAAAGIMVILLMASPLCYPHGAVRQHSIVVSSLALWCER
jgi:hypothetical protein